MKAECYGATRAQEKGRSNEDAFWILRPEGSVAVICDGAGHAQRCAAKVVELFGRHASQALDVSRFLSWASWLKTTDASLLGGPQTTFVGVGVVDDQLFGACAGDSRAYLVGESGIRILTETSSPRLGSGRTEPQAIHARLARRDIVVLMSDGAWTPLSLPAIQRCVLTGAMKHLSDLPSALIELASAKGRLDDMTVVTLRVS